MAPSAIPFEASIKPSKDGVEVPPTPKAWADPLPSSTDFRSDTITHPTPSMAASITLSVQGDDVYGESSPTSALENLVSKLTGHPAALLVTSGTQGNQLCISAHLHGPPHSILCDARAHIIGYEAGAASAISGVMAVPVTPKNGDYLTVEDVRAAGSFGHDVHSCPTKIVCLENTLGGAIMPLEEVRRISEFLRAEHPHVKLHMDGARLWEAVAAQIPGSFATAAEGLAAYASLCDSVSLCFSKGLGAPIGSIIVGDEEFITRARWLRKMLGAGLRQAGFISCPATVAVQENFLAGEGAVLRRCHEKALRLARKWESLGGPFVRGGGAQTNMLWLDLDAAGISAAEWGAAGKEKRLTLGGGRIVVHHQISDRAVEALEALMEDVLSGKSGQKPASSDKTVRNVGEDAKDKENGGVPY